MPYWPSSGNVTVSVTVSPAILWVTYLDSFFSSSPFLCSVAMKSVRGRDMENWISSVWAAKMSASLWEMGTRPNSRVALAGPHSPDAQSGSGTITVCRSEHTILNLHTDLNFMGSPVRYSCGVTALAKMSRRSWEEHGACTRNATVLPTTDCITNLLRETPSKLSASLL